MDVSFKAIMPEINEDPIESEVKEVFCNSCNKKLGNIIFLPEVEKTQKIKCICPCGGESFVMKIDGKMYLDFPNIKDTDIEDEVNILWLN